MLSLTYVEIDVPSFDAASPVGTQTFRFAMPADYLPIEIECIPSIDAVTFTPALVSLGKDLGQRAKISVTLADHRHIFNGEPYNQGTFWGKWRGRYGTTLRGCPLRVIRGRLGQTLAEMDTRHYLVDVTSGPDPNNGRYVIEAKDLLKFADRDRSQAPVLSNGVLAGSITNSATSVTLSPTGIGDAEYPASGWVSIGGKEVVSFTRSGDVLTITRGQLGSVPDAHDAGDRAQLVLRYDGDDVADIIRDLLVNYAGVDASYIDLAEWQLETASNLGVIYARTITEPTGVAQLVSELIEQAALALWWDDRSQRIRLAVLREISTDTATFSEENIIAKSMRVMEQPLERISQIWTYYGQRDPTDRGAEEDNFRAALATVDLDKETEYGSAEIRKINGTWIETETAAQRLNAIQLSRFRDPPRNFRFAVMPSELVSLVQGYTLEWWGNQDAQGLPVPAKIQITQIGVYPDRLEIEAEEMLASGDLPALVNVVFLTSPGAVRSWTVPLTWNDADNSVHCIGGGGGGGPGVFNGGGGGGGGGYSRANNLDLTPGGSVSYRVAAAVGSEVDGEDSWFGNAVYASASVGAKGGEAGTFSRTAGQGGQASGGIGSLKYSGGNGGIGGSRSGNERAGGGGGGGAAGPNGNGGRGGNNSTEDRGSGGGGADGGFTGPDDGSGSYAAGGNNRFNFGGGASSAGAGDEGGGGGGGNEDQAGGPGGAGEQIWTQTVSPIISAGPGGGGGGGGDDAAGGRGGLYGGGGGGAGDGSASGGIGEQGLIVVIWRNA